MKQLIIALLLALGVVSGAQAQVSIWTNRNGGGGGCTAGSACSGTTITATTGFLAASGTTSVPSYSFSTYPTTGLYVPAANEIGVLITGTNIARFNASVGFIVNPSYYMAWASSAAYSAYDTVLSRYGPKQLAITGDGNTGGSSTSGNTGFILGSATPTISALWWSGLTPSGTNYALSADATTSTINAVNTVQIAGSGTVKAIFSSAAGQGPSITAGTAVTDVSALSITRTNNNAAVIKGVEIVYTDTSSNSAFLPLSILGGASGTSELFKSDKYGTVTVAGNFRSGTSGNGFYNPDNAGTGYVLGASNDANLSRISPGVIGVGTGGPGSTAGSLKLTGLEAVGSAVTLSGLASDAATTNNTVCLTTTTGVLTKGSGALGICLGTSSERYKIDIASLDVGLSEIMKLRPVSYYTDAIHGDPSKVLYGFTAEQGGTVLPKLMGLDKEGRPNTFDYMGVVPVLVKATQELEARVRKLESLN